jgi:hypothetical protein
VRVLPDKAGDTMSLDRAKKHPKAKTFQKTSTTPDLVADQSASRAEPATVA